MVEPDVAKHLFPDTPLSLPCSALRTCPKLFDKPCWIAALCGNSEWGFSACSRQQQPGNGTDWAESPSPEVIQLAFGGWRACTSFVFTTARQALDQGPPSCGSSNGQNPLWRGCSRRSRATNAARRPAQLRPAGRQALGGPDVAGGMPALPGGRALQDILGQQPMQQRCRSRTPFRKRLRSTILEDSVRLPRRLFGDGVRKAGVLSL